MSDRDEQIQAARKVLTDLGFDGPRTNERSALVLLSLLRLKPDDAWNQATNGMYRIVEIMAWMREAYEKNYKPNTRETIRRQSLHQFVDAALAVLNPDNPQRPTNSGLSCYQISPEAFDLLRQVGTDAYEPTLTGYLQGVSTLRERYAAAREREQIPVRLLDGTEVTLTPGGQNVLLKQMIEEFCSRWTPGGTILYIGDAGKADPVFEQDVLRELGVDLDKHGKLPDLIVHLKDRDWLVLMEAASSHGPVDAKRHGELEHLFENAAPGLVYVSCFPSRVEMRKFLADIAWETEVWCADNADHLIHFNGERFLGPY